MAKLLRNRWLHWSLLASALCALGGGIHYLQPPEPMCVIDAGTTPRHFADGGRKLVTLPYLGVGIGPCVVPLQVWDTPTGVEINHHFVNHGENTRCGARFSSDGRYCATEGAIGEREKMTDHNLRIIDVVAGKEHKIPLDDRGGGEFAFSPKGDVLVRAFGDTDARDLQIYDTASGRMLDTLPKARFWHLVSEESLFYTTRTKGAGIGLAVVKRIMDDHAPFVGRIDVRSPAEGGARFDISLPTTRPLRVKAASLPAAG